MLKSVGRVYYYNMKILPPQITALKIKRKYHPSKNLNPSRGGGGGSCCFLFRIMIFEILVGPNTPFMGETFGDICRPLCLMGYVPILVQK